MISSLIAVSTLLVSVALVMAGYGMQVTVLPLRAELEDFSRFAIGAAASVYSIGFVIGCLIGPYAIVRAGHIRAFAALISVASGVALLHVIVIDPWAWALFRGMTGMCIAGFYICIESWLNDRATNETRGFILSIYVVTTAVGIIAGQIAVAFGDISSFVLFALASVIVSFAVVPVSLTTSAQPAPVRLVRFRPGWLYATSPAAFVSIFLIGVSIGTLLALAPLYATAIGYDSRLAALFAAAMFTGGAVMQWPLGRASDLTDRRLVLIGCAAGVIVAGLALVLFADSAPLLVLGIAALVGGFNQPGYAIANAHAFDHAAPEDYVETSSGVLMMYGIGAAVGPVVGATLMQWYGPNMLFFFLVAVQATMIVYLVTRIRARRPVAAKAKEEFDYASTAPVTAMGNEEAWEQTDQMLVPETYGAAPEETGPEPVNGP